MSKPGTGDREFKEYDKLKFVGHQVICITCGVKIRENASDDAFGLCLRCFYAMLAARLRASKRVAAGEFVSDR